MGIGKNYAGTWLMRHTGACFFPGERPVLLPQVTVERAWVLVIPVKGECHLHGESDQLFLPHPRGLGSILNVFVLHLLTQKDQYR